MTSHQRVLNIFLQKKLSDLLINGIKALLTDQTKRIMAELPSNHPYFHNHSFRNSHFTIASSITSLGNDCHKLSTKHQALLRFSLTEYEAIKNTLDISDRKFYEQYHKLLNHLIYKNTQMVKELDEYLKDHLAIYSLA